MSSSSSLDAAATHRHVDALDGWRGVAIALLLIGHFFPVRGINLGHVGVNFFFVLSGLLMTRILFVQDTPLPVFYRRRIARILPAHLVFIALVLLFWLYDGRNLDMSEALAALFFVNNYVGADVAHQTLPFGHIWSLSVEEQSYIVLSLLALVARHRRWPGARALAAAALVCAGFACVYPLFYGPSHLAYHQWLHAEVAAWGIFVSGFILLALRGRRPRVPAPAVPALVLAGVLLHWWSVPLPVQKLFGVGALALAVNLLPQAPGWVSAAFSLKPLRLLGLWSFSLYLWQQPFYAEAGMPRALGLLLALGAGLLSYYLVEAPMRRYLNRNWGSAPKARPAAAA